MSSPARPDQYIAGLIVRALTLWRPWPWAFVEIPEDAGPKRVENRTWAPPEKMIGGLVALHAGATFDRTAALRLAGGAFGEGGRLCPLEEAAHPRGVIVAVARLRGYGPHTDRPGDPWAFGPVCWDLPDVFRLPQPVACQGYQGLWRMPAPALEAVADQVERAGVFR